MAFWRAKSRTPRHIAVFRVVDSGGFIGRNALLDGNRKNVFLVEGGFGRNDGRFLGSNIGGFVWESLDVLQKENFVMG